ncbi:phenylalanine--tRNA ligase subunit alpha [Actinacidiphila yeochonensis]|uniref:phenylalanine--tRNA ligase subunit alpha n=1 Tax=Actinacidiphila yeochonensis TaxID=89050 RepID=UPI00055ACCF5|nr:phenylalanine--tRNA ligase subunit alpha [Actinacidiphila yeochonensis]
MSAPNKSYDPVEVEALQPEQIERMRDEALAAIAAAADLDALAHVKTAHTGGTSPLALANREIGALPPQAKAEAGKRVGQARGAVNKALAARQAELETERDVRVLVEEAVDVTLPYDRRPAGARHPMTTLSERIEDIFTAMGYEVAEGPEVEAEWFNFDALNISVDNPVRSEQDTMFLAGPDGTEDTGRVLRTHTSGVQIRSLLERELPVYVIAPGRVYRTDALDATHTPVFHQVELLAVDEGLTMADLKGTLDHMVVSLFGEGMTTRLRPNHFPFTEPSAEMDMLCYVCRGTSAEDPERPCRTCSSEGWIELGGCGVVNPKVLTACGIDPQRYSGFAFGFGIERMLMFRHNVEDMRDIVEGDVRFTLPFGMEI